MPIIGTAPNQTYQRTDGEFSGAAVCQQSKESHNNTAVLADARENDIATALNVMLMKTGGNTPTGNLPMGGFKHTGVGAAAGSGQYAEYAQMLAAIATCLDDAKTYADGVLEEDTVCVFYQATAPTGWTKVTTHNDKAIRIVSGTGGSAGGSTAFSAVFALQTPTGTVGGHTLTITEMPLHGHAARWSGQSDAYSDGYGGILINSDNISDQTAHTGSPSSTFGDQIGGTGGGDSHDHTWTGAAMDFRVQYLDCILASKDAAAH